MKCSNFLSIAIGIAFSENLMNLKDSRSRTHPIQPLVVRKRQRVRCSVPSTLQKVCQTTQGHKGGIF